MDDFLTRLFDEGLASLPALKEVARSSREFPEAAEVARYVAGRPASKQELQALLRVVAEARAELGRAFVSGGIIDEALVKAVRLGEHVVANLGPGARVALPDFTALLSAELELDETTSYDMSGLGHAALHSMGPAAEEAIEALLGCSEPEGAGATLAAIVAGRKELQQRLHGESEEQVELLLSMFRALPPSDREYHVSFLLGLLERVSDLDLKNRILSALQEAGLEVEELARKWRLRESPVAEVEAECPSDLKALLRQYMKRPSEGRAERLFVCEHDTLRTALSELDLEPELWSRFFARLCTHDGSELGARLAFDAQLCKAAGRAALPLLPILREFLETNRGDGYSRPLVFDLIAGLEEAEFLNPLLTYLRTNPSHDFHTARGCALQALGALLDANPNSQEELAVLALERGDELALTALAAAGTPLPSVVRRIFAARESLGQDLVVLLLSKSGETDADIVDYLQHRVESTESYSRVLAQEALVECCPDITSAVELLKTLLQDEEYGFGAYEGWVEDPVHLATKLGKEAAVLTPLVIEYARQNFNPGLALQFLEGLGPGLASVREEVAGLLHDYRREDPLDLEEDTRRLVALLDG